MFRVALNAPLLLLLLQQAEPDPCPPCGGADHAGVLEARAALHEAFELSLTTADCTGAERLEACREIEVKLEEAFAVTRSLPAGLQIKAGQFYTAFGRANPQHLHQWDFVDQPVILSFSSCGNCTRCLRGEPGYCATMSERNFGARRPDGGTAASTDAGPVGSHFFGQSSFATHAVVDARAIVPVGDEVDLVAPGDSVEFGEQLLRVLEDPDAGRVAPSRVAGLTWDRAAAEFAELYWRIAGNR